jgi:hypothetical protein
MGNMATVVSISDPDKKECHICHETTDYKLARCVGCKKWFCTDHPSKANLLYCEHCVIDVGVVEETFQRVEEVEDWNEETDTVVKSTIKSTPAKKISFEGADWTFMCGVIRNLTDEECGIQIQVMRGAVSLLEHELTQRKIRKTVVARDQNGNLISKRVTEVKSVKTSRIKKPIDLAAMAAKLKGLNLTKEQMEALLKTL